MSGTLELRPLPSDREVAAGDDLAAVLLAAVDTAEVTLVDGDVLVVASKVVAKAEGATAALPPGQDVQEARRALARRVARRVVADTPWVLVVETHHGLVCANAGIDHSNVPDESVALLLPDDPDGSAAALRAAVRDATGATVGVVVSDTFGRPWRLGQTDVAVGAAGITTLRDDRGGHDRHGRELAVTMAAVGDAVAAAADLVRTKGDGTPFVLVRGLDVAGDGRAADLVRPSAEDVFRAGGPTAAHETLAAGLAALLPTGAPPPGPTPLPAMLLAAVPMLVDLGRPGTEVTPTPATDTEAATITVHGRPADVGAVRAGLAVLAAAHDLVVSTTAVEGGVRCSVGRAVDTAT